MLIVDDEAERQELLGLLASSGVRVRAIRADEIPSPDGELPLELSAPGRHLGVQGWVDPTGPRLSGWTGPFGSRRDRVMSVLEGAAKGDPSARRDLADEVKALLSDWAHLARAQRLAGIGLWEWDLTTGEIVLSREGLRIFGRDEPPGRVRVDDLWAQLHPDDADAATALTAEAFAGSNRMDLECRVIGLDGRLRWVSVRGEVWDDGDAKGMRGTSVDISDWRRADEEVRRLAAVVEASADAIATLGLDGAILTWNPAAARMLGYSADEAAGRPVVALVAEERREDVGAVLERVVASGGRVECFETVTVAKDGRRVETAVSLAPVRDGSGQLVAVAAIARDITERKAFERALAHRALHDPQTGLANRTLLSDRVEMARARTRRSGTELAALFVDIDRFKLLNDSRGHAAGDELLSALGKRLRSAVRPTDTVARFGGDEFVVLCEATTKAEAVALARRITEQLSIPYSVTGGEVYVSVSVGVAMGDGEATAEELLSDADAAMYRAKERGRARVEVFDRTMRGEATARLEMQSGLHRALERGELVLFYQPVVEVASGRVAAVEALLRWVHPEQGLLPPSRFIAVAEESGLIEPIGDWVFEEAARAWGSWSATTRAGCPGGINVNLSALQLRAGTAERLGHILECHGMAPEVMCLELTETALTDDAAQPLDALLALKELGVRLAIDDFGTGYGSLQYLERFPVDVLKIDKSFVSSLGSGRAGNAIVGSVIDLAHALDLQAVAEGVERGGQLAELRFLGCDMAQGHHFSRALPAHEITGLLDAATVRPSEPLPLRRGPARRWPAPAS